MILPAIVQALVNAQNSYDSNAYANCFSETAIVFDEGKNHVGKAEIKQWIEEANENYKTALQPTGFEEVGTDSILTVNVSGAFEGSPTVMKYHLKLVNGLIRSLKITG